MRAPICSLLVGAVLLALLVAAVDVGLYDRMYDLSDPASGRITVYGPNQLQESGEGENCTSVLGEFSRSDSGEKATTKPAVVFFGPYDTGKSWLENHLLEANVGSGLDFTTPGLCYKVGKEYLGFDMAGTGQTETTFASVQKIRTEETILQSAVAKLGALPVMVLRQLDKFATEYIRNAIETIIQARRTIGKGENSAALEMFVVVNDRFTTDPEVMLHQVAAQVPLQIDVSRMRVTPINPEPELTSKDNNVNEVLKRSGRMFELFYQDSGAQSVKLHVFTLAQHSGDPDSMGALLLRNLLKKIRDSAHRYLLPSDLLPLDRHVKTVLQEVLPLAYGNVESVTLKMTCDMTDKEKSKGVARQKPKGNWLDRSWNYWTSAKQEQAEKDTAHYYRGDLSVAFKPVNYSKPMKNGKQLIDPPHRNESSVIQPAPSRMPYTLTSFGELQRLRFEIPGCHSGNMGFSLTPRNHIRVRCSLGYREKRREQIVEDSFLYGPSEYEVAHFMGSADYGQWCQESTEFDNGLVSLYFGSSESSCKDRMAEQGLVLRKEGRQIMFVKQNPTNPMYGYLVAIAATFVIVMQFKARPQTQSERLPPTTTPVKDASDEEEHRRSPRTGGGVEALQSQLDSPASEL